MRKTKTKRLKSPKTYLLDIVAGEPMSQNAVLFMESLYKRQRALEGAIRDMRDRLEVLETVPDEFYRSADVTFPDDDDAPGSGAW